MRAYTDYTTEEQIHILLGTWIKWYKYAYVRWTRFTTAYHVHIKQVHSQVHL
jgi:hypothetical protein